MLQISQLSFWERKSFFESIDYTIIGAGIVGYSTAINLKREFPKAKILILEKGYLPSGASSKNAGFACFGSPTEICDDLQKYSEDQVWETISMRYQGLQELFSTLKNRDIGYQKNGSWELIEDSNSEIEIDRHFLDYLNHKCERFFKKDRIYSEDTESFNTFGFRGIKTSYFNAEEGQLDTGKLIQQLHEVATSSGITSLFGIELVHFEEESDKVLLNTNIGDIYSSKLLICTNGFASKFLPKEVKPARAQVLVTNEIENLSFKGTFHLDRGYYYFRNIGNRILLGGGRNLDFEGETTTELELTDKIQSSLRKKLHEVILPNIEFSIDYQWAGIMGVGESKSPIIRKYGNHVAFGVRMGGMGVAIGSLVGKQLSKLIG